MTHTHTNTQTLTHTQTDTHAYYRLLVRKEAYFFAAFYVFERTMFECATKLCRVCGKLYRIPLNRDQK